LKIVFMGTPDLAAEVLDTMMKSGCEVTLAVTQPDRPKGRGRGVEDRCGGNSPWSRMWSDRIHS